MLNSVSSSSLSTSLSCDIEEGPPLLYSDEPSSRPTWEKFDEASENEAPPLPPPREELLQELDSTPPKDEEDKTSETKVVFVLVEGSSPQPPLNPFEPLDYDKDNSPSKSPISDFSSSVTTALRESLENLTADSESTVFASTGQKMWETFEGPDIGSPNSVSSSSLGAEVKAQVFSPTIVLQPTISSSSLPQTPTIDVFPHHNTMPSLHHTTAPLTDFPSIHSLPVASCGASTAATNTLQSRTSPFRTSHYSHSRTSSMSKAQFAVASSILRPIPHEGLVSTDSITNPFYSGSINAGDYPALTKLSQRPLGPRTPNYVQNLPLPGKAAVISRSPLKQQHKHTPPKPQPYSGQYGQEANTTAASTNSNSNSNKAVLDRRDSRAPFLARRLPSLGEFNPFGDLVSPSNEVASMVIENPNSMR